LDVEVAPNDLLTGLIERVGVSTTQRLNDTILIVGVAA
jgi:hypothetical protein